MNVLLPQRRLEAIGAMSAGMSVRRASEAANISRETAQFVLHDAGPVCAKLHQAALHGWQVDGGLEAHVIRGFCYRRGSGLALPDAGDWNVIVGLHRPSGLVVSIDLSRPGMDKALDPTLSFLLRLLGHRHLARDRTDLLCENKGGCDASCTPAWVHEVANTGHKERIALQSALWVRALGWNQAAAPKASLPRPYPTTEEVVGLEAPAATTVPEPASDAPPELPPGHPLVEECRCDLLRATLAIPKRKAEMPLTVWSHGCWEYLTAQNEIVYHSGKASGMRYVTASAAAPAPEQEPPMRLVKEEAPEPAPVTEPTPEPPPAEEAAPPESVTPETHATATPTYRVMIEGVEVIAESLDELRLLIAEYGDSAKQGTEPAPAPAPTKAAEPAVRLGKQDDGWVPFAHALQSMQLYATEMVDRGAAEWLEVKDCLRALEERTNLTLATDWVYPSPCGDDPGWKGNDRVEAVPQFFATMLSDLAVYATTEVMRCQNELALEYLLDVRSKALTIIEDLLWAAQFLRFNDATDPVLLQIMRDAPETDEWQRRWKAGGGETIKLRRDILRFLRATDAQAKAPDGEGQ